MQREKYMDFNSMNSDDDDVEIPTDYKDTKDYRRDRFKRKKLKREYESKYGDDDGE